MPKDLTDEIDDVVGQRHRSSFICEAAKEKLIRQKQAQAIHKFAGSLRDEDYPEWKNSSADWVHNLRQEDERIREGRLKRSSHESSNRHKRPNRRSQEKAGSRRVS
jgi:hypothetical protein